MSCSLDLNLLVYASDAGSPFHDGARTFLAQRAAATELLYIAWPTLMGYLRIVTNPRACHRPLAISTAMANVRALVGLPQVRLLTEQEGFLGVYEEVTRGLSVSGNLIPDAHLAALLRQHGVHVLYTNDADFRRFSFLEVRNPLATGSK